MIIPFIISLLLNIMLIFKEQIEYKLLIFIVNILLLIFILKKYYNILYNFEKQEKQLEHLKLDINLHNLNEKYVNERKEKRIYKRNNFRSIVI